MRRAIGRRKEKLGTAERLPESASGASRGETKPASSLTRNDTTSEAMQHETLRAALRLSASSSDLRARHAIARRNLRGVLKIAEAASRYDGGGRWRR